MDSTKLLTEIHNKIFDHLFHPCADMQQLYKRKKFHKLKGIHDLDKSFFYMSRKIHGEVEL